jgi:hypothetical protein
VYLPKRFGHQGTLYEMLTRGFEWQHVREHFNLDRKRRAAMDELLKEYTIPLSIDTINEFFWVYSMYEVDGVFSLSDAGGESTRNERSDPVHVLSRPEGRRMHDAARRARNVRLGPQTRDRASEQGRPESQRVGKDCPKLKDYIDRWIGAVGRCSFSDIILNLTEQIRGLYGAGRQRLEDKIWVTSLWSLRSAQSVVDAVTQPALQYARQSIG